MGRESSVRDLFEILHVARQLDAGNLEGEGGRVAAAGHALASPAKAVKGEFDFAV